MAASPSAPPKPRRERASPSLRERFDAMRNLPPFLRQIWATSPGLTLTSLGLRLVRSLLPVATLYIGKLIIDEAIRLVGLGLQFDGLGEALRGGQLSHLLSLLALPSWWVRSASGTARSAPIRDVSNC